ncbi:DNA polymerase III subunit gamma/tau [Metamycoplasma phocicerebrale]|uniref:DNA polymerase III subunit gamma/tau n=1 Tax=Metamycoplasma phocicerebrale TaxID=142649 RepID=A0A3Q9V9A7_9BACT|nr:DNA polymerase III subunit gamma/tau [Metamycoplasma phocicerebrale]AZZ65421.1 DNA polymerase III subunit gamma/tau [Metamycoplasma phocicerebrale]
MSLTQKYLALYRQYRPKTFDEVKGQEHIINTLKNIIKENKLTHAYLFCGPHGNGKTSTAKIFANAINCSHRTSENPCDECIASIDRNMDIIEIDAASNTGIDDIRQLREKIKLLPTNGKYKVYIIDEVHMLSKGAFNALLKTLEEPPKHVIFILATTDPQKIPLTILSRVQRFNFKKIDKEILFNQIKDIFIKENIKADDEAIKLIVELGNGSFRDTLSIADQVAIYCANDLINKKSIEDLYGIVDFNNIWSMIKLIDNADFKLLIDKFNSLVDNGASIEKLSLQIFKTLKDYAIYKKTNDEKLLEYASKQAISELNIDDDRLFKYIELITEAIKEIQYSDLPRQVMEIYLLKMASNKSKNQDQDLKINFNSNNSQNNIVKDQLYGFENNSENNEEDDFHLVNKELLDDNETETKTNYKNNAKDFNSVFNLANISNSYNTKNDISLNKNNAKVESLGLKEENLDKILEKTSEILISDATKEYENDDILNEIITSEFSNDISETKNDVNVLKPELSQSEVDNLAFIYQYAKQNIYNYGNKKQSELDVMNYNMLDKKIGSKFIHLKDLLSGFKIFFSIDQLIVLKSADIIKVRQLNLKRTDTELMEALFNIFNRYLNVVAINQDQLNIAIENCKNTWKAKKNEQQPLIKLPSLDKYRNKTSPSVEYAKKIFGDIVKEPKK